MNRLHALLLFLTGLMVTLGSVGPNLVTYFAMGLGFYIGMAVKDPRDFFISDLEGILLGLIFGFLLWPIGLIIAILLVTRKI